MIYVLSDVHGNKRRFDSVLEQINLQPTDTLYVLGDVIDRHPHGISILQHIMKMPNVKMILGNHEHMMLNALDDDTQYFYEQLYNKDLWYSNGGKVTHYAFNQLCEEEQREILRYLRNLPLNEDVEVNGQHYKLVHGGPVDGFVEDAYYENSMEYAVWKRWKRRDAFPQGYTMVFGHTPTEHYQACYPMEPWFQGNHIGIDCGCGYPEDGHYGDMGRLACLRLDDGKVLYSVENVA